MNKRGDDDDDREAKRKSESATEDSTRTATASSSSAAQTSSSKRRPEKAKGSDNRIRKRQHLERSDADASNRSVSAPSDGSYVTFPEDHHVNAFGTANQTAGALRYYHGGSIEEDATRRNTGVGGALAESRRLLSSIAADPLSPSINALLRERELLQRQQQQALLASGTADMDLRTSLSLLSRQRYMQLANLERARNPVELQQARLLEARMRHMNPPIQPDGPYGNLSDLILRQRGDQFLRGMRPQPEPQRWPPVASLGDLDGSISGLPPHLSQLDRQRIERSYLLAQQHSQSELLGLLRGDPMPPVLPSLGASSPSDFSGPAIFPPPSSVPAQSPRLLDEARRQGFGLDTLTRDVASLHPLSEEGKRASDSPSRLVWPPPALLMDDGFPSELPALIARIEDKERLSAHQVLLRHQIEAFQATDDDIATHTRGRNKPITLKQVGIRCRHCSHLPVARRTKGSTYFPASLVGLYQAAQNMSATHMQTGLCSEMPETIKRKFAESIATKSSGSGAGRPYWAESASKLGLVDTDLGIFFVRDIPSHAQIVAPSSAVPIGRKSRSVP